MNLAFSTRLPRVARTFAALVLVGGAVLVAPHSVMASTVTFTAPSINVPESATTQTYTADVLISDTNTTDILAGYQVDLFLQPTSTFSAATPGLPNDTNIAYAAAPTNSAGAFDFNTTTVTNGTAEPYVYNNSITGNQNNSNDINFAAPGYLNNYTSSLQGSGTPNENFPSDTYANSDVAALSQTWALERVFITVAAGFSGTEYLVWNSNGIANDPDAPYYQLSGAPSTSIDPNLIGGVINVTPEPSSIVMMVLGAVGLFGVGYRRTRSRRA
jgi:hypothetical protein